VARKPPPRGKAASLVANERVPVVDVHPDRKPKLKPPPTHIPTAAPAPKRVPLPPLLDPHRIQPPPAPVRVVAPLRQPPKLTHVHVAKARTSYTPFYKGQKPDHYEPQAGPLGVGMDAPPTGAGAVHYGKPVYKIGGPGPAGDEALAGMSPAQRRRAELYRQKELGTPGLIFRDLATSLVPQTFVDVANGRGPSAHQIGRDVGNLVLNFADPGVGMAVAGVGIHGSQVAKTFVESVAKGRSLREAAVDASRTTKRAQRAAQAAKDTVVFRQVKPALDAAPSRKVVFAQIDQQLPAVKAMKVKAELDAAAAEHADHEARAMSGGTLKERRQAQATAYYDHILHASGGAAHPIPGGFSYGPDAEAAAKNLRQFTNPNNLEKGAAQNEVWMSRHPELADHPVVGPISPEAHLARTRIAVADDPQLAIRLAHWYRELGPMFETFFGEDAPAIIRGFAVSQANDSPAGGLQAVLRLRDKMLRGDYIAPNEASVVSESIQQAIRGEHVSKGMAAKLTDFTDSLQGKTTRTWTANDIAGGSPTAIDIHAQRDLGRIDPKILRTLRERHNLPVAHLQLEAQERKLATLEKSGASKEAVDAQKAKIRKFKADNKQAIAEGRKSKLVMDNPSAGASGASYNYPLREYQAITDHYNEMGAFGKTDWTPAEVQALGWSAIQRFHGVTPENAMIAIDRNTYNLAYSIDHAPEEYRQALALTRAKSQEIQQIITDENAFVRDVTFGPSALGERTGPSMQIQVIGGPEQVDRIAQRLAESTSHEVRVIRPGVGGNGKKFAIELEAAEFAKPAEMRKVWNRLKLAASKKQAPHLTHFEPFSYTTDDGALVHGMRIVTGHATGTAEQNANRLASYNDTIATAVADLRYDVTSRPNNVEVKVFDGQGDRAAAEPAGASSEPSVDLNPSEVDAARAETPLDPGSYAGENRQYDSALSWQDRMKQTLLDETGAVSIDQILPEAQSLDTRYRPRTLRAGDLSVQIPRARSRITNLGERVVDAASGAMDSTVVRDVPGMRLLTSTERAVKAGGRMQRIEAPRRVAAVARELKVLGKLKEGSLEDTAHFWYAQLPADYRNGHGLQLIHDAQGAELQHIVSGEASAALDAQATAIKAAMREAGNEDAPWRFLKQLDEIKTLRRDLPHRVDDITASMAHLEDLIANPPPVDEKVLDALRVLAEDRARILVDGKRLKPERAAGRLGLLARELGLEEDGTEIYMGHRLPKPESFRGSTAPSGGVGRVASPQGTATRNNLVLMKNGRLRATTRVAYEDWHSAQVFEQANIARDDLGQMGVPFKGGGVPQGYVLVNPKGQTIPPHWRSDELAQFSEDAIDRNEIRAKAKDVLQGFIADGETPEEKLASEQALIDLAYQQGQSIGDLRVVDKRLVDRYYKQFRSFKGRSTPGVIYDAAIDAVSTSIIFARVGYIPKNLVQNLIMAMPHQGAYFLYNASRSAQVLADPYLRELLAAEVGTSSATAALGAERTIQKGRHRITHFVTNVADEPVRVSAFLHEAAAAGVISKYKFTLGPSDREKLVRLLTEKGQRQRLNDIRARSVDAMADFTRLTPDQAHIARRLLVIPGWLMAGSRYPFHFAATHPIRSALIAYIALGEPGSPQELRFNDPISHYFHGDKYLKGIDTRWGRLRTSSLNPVSTPWDIALAIVGSIQGKSSPFDYRTTAFDEVNPFLKAVISSAQGDGVLKNLESLIPDYKFVRGLIDPKASKSYPDDSTWQGRLERELGIIPIRVNDPAGQTGPMSTRTKDVPPTIGGGGGGGMFSPPAGSGGGAPGTL
jgi:hypothetical protein